MYNIVDLNEAIWYSILQDAKYVYVRIYIYEVLI